MKRRGKCKGCYPVIKLPGGDIYELIKSSEPDKEQIVEKDIYIKRIKSCEQCEGLIANTTCRYSGNLVYETAAIINLRCFYPGGSKW